MTRSNSELIADLRYVRQRIQYAARLSDVAIEWSEKIDRAADRLEAIDAENALLRAQIEAMKDLAQSRAAYDESNTAKMQAVRYW